MDSNNEAINLSMVIIYSIVEPVINAISLSRRSFNPDINVLTVVALFWFNEECLMLLVFSERIFL